MILSALLKTLITTGILKAIVLCSIFIISVLTIFPDISGQDNGTNISVTNIEGFNHLGINDSFSLSGSVISTVKATASDVENINNPNNSRPENLNGKHNVSSVLIEGPKPFINSEVSDRTTGYDLDSIPILESPLSNDESSEKINQTNSFSNNLVSMLSGIIIQSIEKGNPTITDISLNNNNSLQSNNTLMIVSGNWRMNVLHSNITNFDARLVMITADGTGFHWHVLDNFKNSGVSYFGNDGNIFLNGAVDFSTDSKEIVKKTSMNILINNLETIQIILNDRNVSNHFYGYPIYGTIDKVEIPN